MSTTITLNPDAQGFYNNWASGSTTYSKTTAVSDNSDSTYIAPTGFTFDSFTLSASGIAASSVISSVIVHVRASAASDGSYTLLGRLYNVDQMSAVGSFTGAGATTQEVTYDLPRPGGGAWSVTDIDALEAGIRVNWSVVTPAALKIWVEVAYIPAGVQLEQTRLVASSHVARYGAQPDGLDLPLTPEYLDVDLVTDVPVWHTLIPTAEGTGSGVENWARFLGRASAKTIKPDDPANIVSIELEDLRDYLHTYRDSGITPLDPGGLYDGILVLDPGATRTYDGPVTSLLSGLSGLIVQVPEDVEPVNYQGRLHEGAATNIVMDSTFLSATSSGSPFGQWTGVGVIAMTTGTTIWAQNVAPKHLTMTPTTSGGNTTLAETPITVDQAYYWFSIDHHEAATSGLLSWRLRRNDSGQFWNISGTGWGTTVDNPLPSSTTPIRAAYWVNLTTAAAGTIGLTLIAGTTGVADHVYHVQMESASVGRGWASSRIISSSSAVTRAASSLKITNHSTARIMPSTRGTFICRYRTEWATSDVTTGGVLFRVWRNLHTTDYIASLFYDASSSCFGFARNGPGVTYTASSTTKTMSAGTTGCIGITWQSTDGENGDSSYTLSITLDGLTQATTTSAAFVQSTSSTMYRGSLDGASGHWNGHIWDEQFSPFVLTLPEIRRRMTRST